MSNGPICLFDSGIGGLTVLKKLINKFPDEEYIYLGDLARVPFGDKSKEELTGIVQEIVSWLEKFNPKVIIVACNTSAALMQDIDFKSTSPIVNIVEACAKEIAHSSYEEVTVWATKFTIENHAYKKAINKLNPNIKVQEIACPKLVPIIENLEASIAEKNAAINEYLSLVSKSSSALVLGCTHYPHIQHLIKENRKSLTIDPADAIINIIREKNIVNKTSLPNVVLYTTAQKEKLEKFSKIYLCCDYKVNQISL